MSLNDLPGMARTLECAALSMRTTLITGAAIVLLSLCQNSTATSLGQVAGQAPPVATFKAGVDLVRVAAVVRDRKGRFVQDLSARDFEVTDSGLAKPIADFRSDVTGVSVALLFDVSGSMEGQLEHAREAARHILSWLDTRDEAAVFTFDTHLDERTPFTAGLHMVPDTVGTVVPFGATSLHDAIAAAAKRVGQREGRRPPRLSTSAMRSRTRASAAVVLTDGDDNTSRLTPAEVAAVASEIDVPVYIFGIVPSIDNPAEETATPGAERSALAGALTDLAAATGGHTVMASTPGQRSIAAREIVDELRHQYLIAFESSGTPGWHPLVVRARKKDLVVRARSGYVAGQSRPSL